MGRQTSRIVSSVMSVGTFDAFFGQLTQMKPDAASSGSRAEALASSAARWSTTCRRRRSEAPVPGRGPVLGRHGPRLELGLWPRSPTPSPPTGSSGGAPARRSARGRLDRSASERIVAQQVYPPGARRIRADDAEPVARRGPPVPGPRGQDEHVAAATPNASPAGHRARSSPRPRHREHLVRGRVEVVEVGHARAHQLPPSRARRTARGRPPRLTRGGTPR